jgi:hypothetical protein
METKAHYVVQEARRWTISEPVESNPVPYLAFHFVSVRLLNICTVKSFGTLKFTAPD